jgi:hypothetical protein
MADSATHGHVSILSGKAGHDRSNSLGGSLISRYPPYSQRARNAGRRTQLPFRLFSQGIASFNCRKFHIDNFFVIATQSSQPHRNLRQRANSLNGLLLRLGQANRRSGPVSNSITLARVSIKRHLTNTLTVRPVLLDRKRGVYRDNIATSFGCASHWHRLGDFCP